MPLFRNRSTNVRELNRYGIIFFRSENPNVWLQKYENVVTERIKLIKPVLWKQGFCVITEDRLPNGEIVRYVLLLYDEKRTENFLSFVEGTSEFIVKCFRLFASNFN